MTIRPTMPGNLSLKASAVPSDQGGPGHRRVRSVRVEVVARPDRLVIETVGVDHSPRAVQKTSRTRLEVESSHETTAAFQRAADAPAEPRAPARPGEQPALDLAPAHAQAVRRHRPGAVGRRRA